MLRTCTKCKKELEFDMFGKKKDGKYGLNSTCKICKRKIGKQYKIDNYEKEQERGRKYRLENPEARKETCRKYYDSHRSELKIVRAKYAKENGVSKKEGQKRYRDNNFAKVSEGQRTYARLNRDKLQMWKHNYRSKVKDLPYELTVEQWRDIKAYFNNRCVYCGRKLKLEQEHFIPVVNGGGYTKENIICACRSCNASKNGTDFFLWYKNYKYYSEERENKIIKYLQSVS